jgi:hypothetical protein
MLDITGPVNKLHLKLQGKQEFATQFHDAINAFKTKQALWEGQMNSGNLTHFPACQDYQNHKISQYNSNIKGVISDFQNTFEDLTSWKDDFSLFPVLLSFDVWKTNTNNHVEFI